MLDLPNLHQLFKHKLRPLKTTEFPKGLILLGPSPFKQYKASLVTEIKCLKVSTKNLHTTRHIQAPQKHQTLQATHALIFDLMAWT